MPGPKGKQGLVAPTCLLSPFPLAGPLVVVGKTALYQVGAPPIARHHEGSETAAAEAKRAERRHNPIFFGFTLHCRRFRIFDLEPKR